MPSDYQIVPASIRHVRPMARCMRQDAAVALGAYGFNPRAGLRRAFIASFYTRAALVDDRPIAMWGAVGAILGDTAYVWLVLSDDARHMPRAVLTEARAQLGYIMERYPFITALFLPEDAASVRFARHLGFGQAGDLTDERFRVPLGDSYAVRLDYRQNRLN